MSVIAWSTGLGLIYAKWSTGPIVQCICSLICIPINQFFIIMEREPISWKVYIATITLKWEKLLLRAPSFLCEGQFSQKFDGRTDNRTPTQSTLNDIRKYLQDTVVLKLAKI